MNEAHASDAQRAMRLRCGGRAARAELLTGVGDLVPALDDIFDLQGSLCGLGISGSLGERINATAFLKRRYAAPRPRKEAV